ncbi:hypothetical protein Nepgr_015564 [Nepenthes gracilis]|uniref:GATA-type domain-containing protein n=1 Tax=Nepenthes gracilis TaxID=150966 RepID=A0AAD3XQT4_NEPGR|nr:hypothetical protein Nepgr_015564 [Nepenthes gracilis]
MTPSYFSFQPLVPDLNEDQPHSDHEQQLTFKFLAANSSSLSPSRPNLFNPSHDEAEYDYSESHQSYNHLEVDFFGTYDSGSYGHKAPQGKIENCGLKLFAGKKVEDPSDGSGGDQSREDGDNFSIKWVSPKTRLMKKMLKPDQINGGDAGIPRDRNMIKHRGDQRHRCPPTETDNSSNINSSLNGNNTIRVCADCNTTKTPLWRSGPKGPKSLCNACGIRQRKARAAMATANAAAASKGTVHAVKTQVMNNSKVHHKEKGSSGGSGLQQKKRSKIATTASPDRRKLCLEEFTLYLTKKLSLPEVFPQEEKEAAILLMALSYGLVHG